jgi:hypothetical protein
VDTVVVVYTGYSQEQLLGGRYEGVIGNNMQVPAAMLLSLARQQSIVWYIVII